jgi:hypothetical protein
MPENVFRYLFIIPIILSGCDERERQLRGWQQEQVTELQKQSQENTAAARALVEADAASRKQFVELEQGLQAERRDLSQQYAAVDTDRKALAAARERVPLLATALQGIAALLLGGAALFVCYRLLSHSPDPAQPSELEETLILAVAGETELFDEVRLHLREPTALPIESSEAEAVTALGSEP